jgi:hypothetical protein
MAYSKNEHRVLRPDDGDPDEGRTLAVPRLARALLVAGRGARLSGARASRSALHKLLAAVLLLGLLPDADQLGLVEPNTAAAAVTCNYTIALNVTTADGAGNFAAVRPGNTVCIQAGTRSGLALKNFHGQAGSPITFINSGGETERAFTSV